MAAQKRTGLGRGIGALIPTNDEPPPPVDVFFPAGGTTEVVPAAVSSVEVLDSAQAVAITATRHIPAQNVKSFFIGVP